VDFWQRRLEFLAENLDIALDQDGRVILEDGDVRGRSSRTTELRADRTPLP
jgi:hypothetical protein